MAKHTRKPRCATDLLFGAGRKVSADAAVSAALHAFARSHGRALYDVPRDNQCQFHALLHALRTQLQHPLAASYNAVSLRHAILRQLADAALQDRIWVGVADQDAMSLTNLRATLAANAARFRGRSLHEWFQAMQDPNEFGDANTLIGGMLLFRVRIRVLSTDGVVHVEAPAIFGDDFAPIHGDIVLALHSEIHYLSTTPAVPPAASLCEPSLNSPQPLPSPVPQQTLAASPSCSSPGTESVAGLAAGHLRPKI